MNVRLASLTSRFLYADAVGILPPARPNAWLLLDILEGNQTLVTWKDWIDQPWSIVNAGVARPDRRPPGGISELRLGSTGRHGASGA